MNGCPCARYRLLVGIGAMLALGACNLDVGAPANVGGSADGVIRAAPARVDETGVVTRVIDGDTVDVEIEGEQYRIRYIGMNTPERDETCYQPAIEANRALVDGQTVSLVRDVSETDRYGRLLRYVYVGDIAVNATLVNEGWAEAVEYPPDTGQTAYFRQLEVGAAAANRGCHPTGIFADGSTTR